MSFKDKCQKTKVGSQVEIKNFYLTSFMQSIVIEYSNKKWQKCDSTFGWLLIL